MGRLLILLAVLIGVGALTTSRKRAGTFGKPFPFPTTDAHNAIDRDDAEALADWAKTLSCSEADLVSAMAAVGTSEYAVREYLERKERNDAT